MNRKDKINALIAMGEAKDTREARAILEDMGE